MIKVERQGPCVVWKIARSETKNALSEEILLALTAAVDAAANDSGIRAAVLTGEGRAFASGGDLRELRGKNSPADADHFARIGDTLCAKIEALSIPVIAAVTGVAFGGGAELALACDVRIAEGSAKFSFKQVRMGVTPAWGSVARLVRVVGVGTAARLLYAAHEVNGAEAKITGLVDEVTAEGNAVATALAWGYDIAQGSPNAIAEMKRLVRAAAAPWPALRDEERARFLATWTSPDHAEALNAYFERRSPNWQPR
jgi:enoyl-CoA hydratase/carnithine racemase